MSNFSFFDADSSLCKISVRVNAGSLRCEGIGGNASDGGFVIAAEGVLMTGFTVAADGTGLSLASRLAKDIPDTGLSGDNARFLAVV